MALVVGPMIESNFCNSLTMPDGNLAIFFQRPISAVVLIMARLLLLSTGFSTYRKTKTRLVEETGSDNE